MKILLIQPPVQDFYQTACRTYPMGLAYLAAVLIQDGFEVNILDAHDPAIRKTIPLPTAFQYIRKYYDLENKSPFRLFRHYYHFGLSFEKIETEIRKHKPDLVGISSLFSAYSELALGVARLVKKIDAGITTVMGGPHAWSMPEQLIASGVVDYIFRGEAEWSFLELCRKLADKKKNADHLGMIPGIGFQTARGITLHPEFAKVSNLDDLPFPARNLLDPKDYRIGGRPYTMILTSRGCPHSCGFCALPSTPCADFRKRRPERIIEEMMLCYDTYNMRHFDIEDDNFTLDKKHAGEILDGIRQSGMTKIRLSAMNGISAYSMTQKLASKMHQTGFTHIDLALVSSDTKRRQEVSRPGSLAQFGTILEHVQTYRFRTTVHVILGLPEDSVENMMQALLYLVDKPCLIGASIYYPVPGSKLYRHHTEDFRSISPSFWRSTLASCESYEGQRDEIMTLFYLTRIINYIKHLLSRYPAPEEAATVQNLISRWSEVHLSSEDRSRIEDGVIEQKGRWDMDKLGLFMLLRFANHGYIEKVASKQENGKTFYTFSREFCHPELIQHFLKDARTLSIRTTGSDGPYTPGEK